MFEFSPQKRKKMGRSLRNDKQNIEQHYQAQLQELKKTMVADVQRMQEEVRF